jgi:hypothetical protein
MRVLVTILGLLLTGCVADVVLRHPQTQQTVVCPGGYCPGVLCRPAQERQIRCVDDFQRQGYARVVDGAVAAPSLSAAAAAEGPFI